MYILYYMIKDKRLLLITIILLTIWAIGSIIAFILDNFLITVWTFFTILLSGIFMDNYFYK